MPLTLDQFAKSLEDVGLLTASEIQALRQQKPFKDASEFARELVRQNRLTTFQANTVYKGAARSLILGNYVLLEQIGAGGMGEVYKARHQSMNRVVAMKVIKKERLQKANALKRFQREIQIASALNHPNIVRAFDADEVEGTLLLVMEYVEGTDLAKLVRAKGPLPVEQACDYIRQAALGLQHAHEQGMVHRDIKPSNLLLDKDHTVKILDMGLARSTDLDNETLTREGTVLGTVDYISPEQAANAHTADIRADIYSLGATFYFLLTGRVPFPGKNVAEKLVKHKLHEPEPVDKLRPEVPPHVVAVVRKMMAKKPEQRFQTPAEVAVALAGPPLAIIPAEPPPSVATPWPGTAGVIPPPRPNALLAWAAGLSNKQLLLVAAAALFMLLSCFFFVGVLLLVAIKS